MAISKSWDVGKYMILFKKSDTLWYTKSKSLETRQYHFFDLGYCVYKNSRRVGVKLCFGKFLFFVGWEKAKKNGISC